VLAERCRLGAVSSVDGCRAVTPRGFVRFLGRSSVSRCRAFAATLCHLGCVFVRPGGPIVCLGGAVKRLCSTSFRRPGRISGGQSALARLPVPMPWQ
jgi:hypothetical protein